MKEDIKDPITPNERKGIDLCVKIMKKKYPFIIDWRPIKDYREWEGVLFIVLIIDPNRLSTYLDCPLNDNLSYTLMEYISDYYTLNFFTKSKCLTYEEQSELLDQMDDKIKSLYTTAIPEDFTKNYVATKSEITRGKTYQETLIISGFNVE
jgi:hypothetical protein